MPSAGSLSPHQPNLQQSISQLNQSQAIPWTLTKSEKKQYNFLFRAWDPSNSGFITGQVAFGVFGTSGLPKEDLARIWYAFALLVALYLIPTGLSPTAMTAENLTLQSSMSQWLSYTDVRLVHLSHSS